MLAYISIHPLSNERSTLIAGIPLIFESEIKISAEETYSAQWGMSKTVEQGHSTSVNLVVPAGHKQRARVLAQKGEINVPYTAR